MSTGTTDPSSAEHLEDPLVTVRLIGTPVELHRSLLEYQEELQRELQLIVLGGNDADIPHRMVDLLQQLTVRYEGVGDEQSAATNAASAAGETSIDLDYLVPASVGAACQELNAMFDETDRFLSSSDDMLTLATPRELVVYRRWLFGEFIAQPGGAEPLPWSEVDEDLLVSDAPLRGVTSA